MGSTLMSIPTRASAHFISIGKQLYSIASDREKYSAFLNDVYHHAPRQAIALLRPWTSKPSHMLKPYVAWVKYMYIYDIADQDHASLVESAAWVEVRGASNNRMRSMNRNKTNEVMRVYCKNGSDRPANLSIGLLKGDSIYQHYEPICLWTGVEPGSDILAHFMPRVSAYVTRDYKVNEMLHNQVEADAIWTQNIDEVDDVTGWNLTENPNTGQFSIERADAW
ncbi:unnamed protein product [Rhizoctonia solani]|uniref:Uncharacterized protein n=1 Tax=Rhizoctonia solani TaxID=456999 RepID=A0A8H3AMS4_9AGAM|nr:unnamed protein product [Rhizoctonia solani]